MHEPIEARSAGVTELTRRELKPLAANSVRLREDLTNDVIAHRDDVLAAPVVRAGAQAADESHDSASANQASQAGTGSTVTFADGRTTPFT